MPLAPVQLQRQEQQQIQPVQVAQRNRRVEAAAQQIHPVRVVPQQMRPRLIPLQVFYRTSPVAKPAARPARATAASIITSPIKPNTATSACKAVRHI
jgi:hypothetical protein